MEVGAPSSVGLEPRERDGEAASRAVEVLGVYLHCELKMAVGEHAVGTVPHPRRRSR